MRRLHRGTGAFRALIGERSYLRGYHGIQRLPTFEDHLICDLVRLSRHPLGLNVALKDVTFNHCSKELKFKIKLYISISKYVLHFMLPTKAIKASADRSQVVD